MDSEQIAKAIEADAGMPLPNIREALAKAQTGNGLVTTAKQILVRSARAQTGLSQPACAARIATPVATLRDWKQGRFAPPGAVLCLLRVIRDHPELMRDLEAAWTGDRQAKPGLSLVSQPWPRVSAHAF